MKKFLRRIKVFTENRTVKIGIALVAIASVAVLLVGIFYTRNSTSTYSGDLETNKLRARKLGAYPTEADYNVARMNDGSAQADEKYLILAYQVASEKSLIASNAKGLPDLDGFVRAMAKNPDSKPLAYTEQQIDQMATDMRSAVIQLVGRSREVPLGIDGQRKKDILVLATHIASTLDCRYSWSAFIDRNSACLAIADELVDLLRSKTQSKVIRSVIDACMPNLSKPLRLEPMLRKELLRMTLNYDMLLGERQLDPNSIAYRHPQDFSVSSKFLQKLPNVTNALRSRMYELFSDALDMAAFIKHFGTPNYVSGADPNTIFAMQQKVQTNPASSDLIVHLAPEMLGQHVSTPLFLFGSDMRELTGRKSKMKPMDKDWVPPGAAH
ncbi:MAG: hypothetical protein GC165_00430 [Armatimonadetes bacterium]|nr:hypothetical protein [Armatimonadota bacterium]MBS1729105.1 hypothetical protein [Armatimonadota bacterium]